MIHEVCHCCSSELALATDFTGHTLIFANLSDLSDSNSSGHIHDRRHPELWVGDRVAMKIFAGEHVVIAVTLSVSLTNGLSREGKFCPSR